MRVDGNLIVGDDTVIDNGAIFTGDAVVGNHARVANYCQIYSGCSSAMTVCGAHGAELTGGMLSDQDSLYTSADSTVLRYLHRLGAGTLCRNLQFDISRTIHRTKGRAEAVPQRLWQRDLLEITAAGRHALHARLPCPIVGAGVLAQGPYRPLLCFAETENRSQKIGEKRNMDGEIADGTF